MPEIFKTQRRVEFRDTDMAGIVHFSNFFLYMEQAEHAFLRSLGLSVVGQFNDEKISWPRVNAHCNYRNSVRFEELIDIQVRVTRIGTKSISYGFDFQRDAIPIAEGSVTVVSCVIVPDEKPKAVPVPPAFIDRLQPFFWEETN